MRRHAAAILIALVVAMTLSGCVTNRPSYTESPAAPAPETMVYIIFMPTCTAWHVCKPTREACEAPCCTTPRNVKPRWFE